jgi:hypothetical protein
MTEIMAKTKRRQSWSKIAWITYPIAISGIAELTTATPI